MICNIIHNGGSMFLIFFLCMITTNSTQVQHTFTVQEFCSSNEPSHNIEPGTTYRLNLRSESPVHMNKWFHKTKRKCHKEIRTSVSSAHFEISITNISIPSCGECRCNYFEISTLGHRKKFCGHTDDSFSSKTDFIAIDFHPELNKQFDVTLTFTAQRNFYALTGSAQDTSALSGFLETPYFPNPHPPKYNAEYSLRCDTNSSVLLLFLDFQISNQSFLEVYGINNTHPSIFYGHIFRPPVLLSESNYLNLKFESNGPIGMPGFRAEFSCIKNPDSLNVPYTDCGGRNHGRDGQLNIKTREKFALYDCIWSIMSSSIYSAKSLSVSVLLKHIGLKSKLELLNGRNSKSSVVKEINCDSQNCSNLEEEIVVPASADLYIRFHGYLDGLSIVNISYSTYHTGNCSSAEFKCNDGRCILLDLRCDGTKHCPDGHDEDMCPSTENTESQLTSHPTTEPEISESGAIQQKFCMFMIFGGIAVIFTISMVICLGKYRKRIFSSEQVTAFPSEQAEESHQSLGELSDVQTVAYAERSYNYDNPPSYEDYIKSSYRYPPIFYTRSNQQHPVSGCAQCTSSSCTGARARHFSVNSFHDGSSNTSSDITLNIAEESSNTSQMSPDCNGCNIEINQSFTFEPSINAVRRSYSLDSKLDDLMKKGYRFSYSITHPVCVHALCNNQHACHSLPPNFKTNVAKSGDSREPDINRVPKMQLDSSINFVSDGRRFTWSFPPHRSVGSEIITVVKTRCFSEPCSGIRVECSLY